MARAEAEAQALKWKVAKREKDYTAADSIRAELRAAGYEPDELLEEMDYFGPSGGSGGHMSAEEVWESEPYAYVDDDYSSPEDPLGYKPTVYVPPEARHLFGPTELASKHKDGGTGG